ncbi:hypothetical protein COCON_G00107840 [Conger conger]|uniref:Interleukin 34 n=1 Tax=Conger conger TaxID=82655 RepID=A0A9Q1DJ06_CONCO|nr:interleukin-34 [Conger conger]XP_061101708.1 interleukin-34 [Conger conger]XP_061101709.1 interleukin-34 [Conger conger]XP_061101710.1 interleukin-34 [Conger conger]KAJ8271925.1 hypothetical protein COCON_G00107840 [Conger conger]
MTRAVVWLSSLVLGLTWLLPAAVMSTPPGICRPMNTLKESLNFTNRRQYMKHNFPINYTIRVHYEEVFRVHNISRLNRTREPDPPKLEARDLQELWLLINQEVLKKVLRVLPERHPSRKYVSDLENLFRQIEQVFRTELGEWETPERLKDFESLESGTLFRRGKLVKPKALLDNCYRTMHCVFCDCFQCQENFCDVLHWKRGNKRPPKQA